MSYIVSYENLYLDGLKESFPQESTHILPLDQKETLVFVETNSFHFHFFLSSRHFASNAHSRMRNLLVLWEI